MLSGSRRRRARRGRLVGSRPRRQRHRGAPRADRKLADAACTPPVVHVPRVDVQLEKLLVHAPLRLDVRLWLGAARISHFGARRVALLPRVTLDLFASGPRSLAARHANIFAPTARAALLLGCSAFEQAAFEQCIKSPDAREQRRLPYMLLLTTEESYTLLICALDRGRGSDRALAPKIYEKNPRNPI